MQILENSVIGTRSAVLRLRLRRRGSELEFVVSPVLHVAMPEFYQEVTRRLREDRRCQRPDPCDTSPT
jgi:hypothetical protein